MKPIQSILFLLLLCTTVYGQKEISVLDRETIRKNKVYKCLEYDSNDSVNFFKNHKNGLYSIFDQKGYKAEENAYSAGIISEFKVVYMYDKSGKELMWSWISENSTPQISRVHMNTFDSLGRKTGYCDYSPNAKPVCDMYGNQNEITDTVMDTKGYLNTKTQITFRDKQRKDTIWKNTYYFQKGQLDSCILVSIKKGKISERLITHYFYEGKQLTRSLFVRYHDAQVTETNMTYYLPNGLLNKVEKRSIYYTTNNGKPRIDEAIMKFIYTYWQ